MSRCRWSYRPAMLSLLFAALALAVCCSITPATAATSLPFSLCAQSGEISRFLVTDVQASTLAVSPGQSLGLLLRGALSAPELVDGTAELVVEVAEAEGSQSRLVDRRFGKLSELLQAGSLPIMPVANAEMHMQWSMPDEWRANLEGDENQDPTPLHFSLRAYDDRSHSLVCVSFDLSSKPAPSEPASKNKALGYACALISVLFFGTNFLPVKKFDSGDGVFFQWVMSVGIWLCGLVVQLVRDSPAFEPIAMVGGLLWCLGNVLSVPIIQCVGLGVGICVWGASSLVVGWATGRFGVFGIDIKKQEVDNNAMNYIGILLCIASMAFMFRVKVSGRKVEQEAAAAKSGSLSAHLLDDSMGEPALAGAVPLRLSANSDGEVEQNGRMQLTNDATSSWTDRLSPTTRRVLGLALAVFSGCCYGVVFIPANWLMDSGRGKSSHGIDYVFSHFCGILFSSTIYLLAYSVYRRNRPQVLAPLLAPGMLSGMVWAVAQISWFIANDQVGSVGTYPLVACGPGIVATLCAIILFKEIQGKRNYLMLAAATAVMLAGVLLIAFSLPSKS